MPKSKKLQKQIETKLDQLSKLADTLYGLAENLKETLKLLEDQTGKQLDDFGEPIILEIGILSLLDDWESEKEEE